MNFTQAMEMNHHNNSSNNSKARLAHQRRLQLYRRPEHQHQRKLYHQPEHQRKHQHRHHHRSQAKLNAHKKVLLAIQMIAGKFDYFDEKMHSLILWIWCWISHNVFFYKNCSKFYRCVSNGNNGFIKYEFQCGPGTVWDQEIQGCNHAWAVPKCGGNAVSSDSSSSQWQSSGSNSQSSSSSSSNSWQEQSQSNSSQSQQSSSSSQSGSR